MPPFCILTTVRFYGFTEQKMAESILQAASVENGDISLYDDRYSGVNLHGSKFRRDGGMDADSSRLRPHSKALIHRIRKFPFKTNGSRRDTLCHFRPEVNA